MPKRSPKADADLIPITLEDGMELEYCPVTKGIWLDADELSLLTHLAEDIPGFETAISDAVETPHPSPVSAQNLKEVRFHPDHDVRIDVCLESGGIWLDRGELEKLQQIAAHLDSPQSRVLRAAQHLKKQGFELIDARTES